MIHPPRRNILAHSSAMRTLRGHLALVCCSVVALFGFAGLCAADTVILLGPDLQPRVIRLQGLADGVMTYFDSDRQYQTTRLNQWLRLEASPDATADGEAPSSATELGISAIATTERVSNQSPSAEDRPRPRTPILETTDGQVLPGVWLGAANEGQALRWSSPVTGQAVVPLDRIRRVTLKPVPSDDAAADQGNGADLGDIVHLGNEDRLQGFVLSLTDDGVVIELADGSQVTMSLDRIDQLNLANPHQTRDADQHLLTFKDGARVLIRDPAFSDGVLTFDPILGDATRQQTTLTDMRSLVIDHPDWSLRPLLAQAWRVTAGGEALGLPVPPRLVGPVDPHHGGGTLRLHAPVTVAFNLPPGASRLIGVVELAPEVRRPEVTHWLGCELIVSSAPWVEPMRHELDAQTPRITIDASLVGERLEIELQPGRTGPVLDQVLLRHAWVLVRRSDG